MKHRCAAALLAWPLLAGADSGVPAAVATVVSGGYWQAEGRSGSYRVVVALRGFETVGSRVIVEWVAGPKTADDAAAVVAAVEPALPEGEPVTWTANLQRVLPGCVRITLRGVNTMLPSQRSTRTVWALAPGQIELSEARSAKPPAACRGAAR